MLDWIVNNETNLTAKLKKKYLFSYFGTDNKDLVLDVSNPFVRFYLSNEVLQIVSIYLRYVPQLFEVYVEKTMPVGSETPSFSQNWHRDPEEKKTLKVFIYLSDVTEESGPFTYVLGSSPTGTGKHKNLFPQKLPHGSYPSEIDVSSKVKLEDLLIATGVQGSIIFCDTSGLHRGGYAKSDYRIMSTGFYPSKYYSERSRFSVKGLDNHSEATILPLARKVLGIDD
jgi:ectoine hydroxylase-related dioxygenase (phytanoyl-CoA dioxygenase family)